MKKIDLYLTFLKLPIDALAIFLGFVVSYVVRGNSAEVYLLPYNEYLTLIYPIIPIWLVMYALQGLYNLKRYSSEVEKIIKICLATLTGWAGFIVYMAFLKTQETFVFPRLMLVYILIFTAIFVIIGRTLIVWSHSFLRYLGIGRTRVAVIGNGELAASMDAAILSTHDSQQNYLGKFDLVEPSAIGTMIKQKKIEELIVADSSISNGKAFEYLLEIQKHGAVCHFVPNMFDAQVSNVVFSTRNGMPVLTFRQTPLEGWGRIAKRLFDVCVAGTAMLVLSPVYGVLALIIALTDYGPIFYGHSRIGRGGKPFKMYKFRSMIAKYCAGTGYSGKTELEIFTEMNRQDLIEEFKRDHKVKNDPRISPIGRLMRKTRLDELPQLWNVIKGDLSLVGPRPIVTAELEKYGRWASYLKSIKPGVTGLWQVSGGNDISYDERVKLDAHYVQNWSLWQDLIILAKTAITIIWGKSAY